MRATILCACLSVSLLAGTIFAQEDSPRIGYAFPSGGQQGTEFHVLLGGEHLDGATRAYISGDGVKARAIQYTRPLNQGQFKEMQNRIGEMMRKKEAGEWTEDDERQLAELRDRLSDFAIRRFSVPALAETVLLDVSIDDDAAPGTRELRLQTDLGLTNPLVFCVGQLPECTETSGRAFAEGESHRRGGRGRKTRSDTTPDPGTTPLTTELEPPAEVTLPTTINGQILPGDIDRYRLHALEGQQLVVAVSARELIPYLADAVPGWFQATVSLSQADGGEVAYSDDFRFHPDPVLHCEIPADGEYVIEVKDALFRGREDFVYRIAIGELPFVTSIFPLGAQAGTTPIPTVNGWNVPATAPVRDALSRGRVPISVGSDGLISNETPFEVDVLPECLDREPNNNQASAQLIEFPMIVNGRIDAPKDADVFRLECPMGARITAEVLARRLNSPLDSMLELTNARGERLAFSDDWEDVSEGLVTHHADSRLTVTTPKDGVCYLRLWDAQGQGGTECAYRLRVDVARPDFQLRVVPSTLNARAGTTVPLTIHALRTDGFEGEIDLRLKSPPPGFALAGARVPACEDVVQLTLTVPSDSLSEPVALSLEGIATIDGQPAVRIAVPADDRMQAFIYRHLVPAGDLLVSVLGSQRRFSAGGLQADPIEIPVGGTVRVAVNVPPTCFFGAVELELATPPPGITLVRATLDTDEGEIVLAADATAVKPGLAGNLIVQAFGVRTAEDSGHGKEKRKKRRILLTALPAIPFVLVGD